MSKTTNKTNLRTFTASRKGQDCNWTLEDWERGKPLMVNPLDKGYKPYKNKERVLFKWSDKWSICTASVYSWIDNVPYVRITPNNDNHNVYILHSAGKCCAGDKIKERDIFVDGRWFYYIKDFKQTTKKSGNKTLQRIEFTIDGDPHDVPAIIRESHEEGLRAYMGEITVGDFKVLIRHASPDKRRWLSKEMTDQAIKALENIFKNATTECKFL